MLRPEHCWIKKLVMKHWGRAAHTTVHCMFSTNTRIQNSQDYSPKCQNMIVSVMYCHQFKIVMKEEICRCGGYPECWLKGITFYHSILLKLLFSLLQTPKLSILKNPQSLLSIEFHEFYSGNIAFVGTGVWYLLSSENLFSRFGLKSVRHGCVCLWSWLS